MSLIFIERAIKSGLDNRLAWVLADKTRFTSLWTGSGLTQAEIDAFWADINKTDIFQLRYGYPNDAEKFPSIRIIPNGGSEDQQYLAHLMQAGDLETRYGAQYDDHFSIAVFSRNVDQCLLWHKFIKCLVQMARKNELDTTSIRITRVSYSALAPMTEYGAPYVYSRSVDIDIIYEDSFYETFTENDTGVVFVETFKQIDP